MIKALILLALITSSLVFSQVNSNEIHVKALDVEKAPEFPGGINEFRRLVIVNMDADQSKLDKGIFKAMATFKIRTDGSLDQIQVNGKSTIFNDKVRRAIAAVKVKWNPAEINNRKVIHQYTTPFAEIIE